MAAKRATPRSAGENAGLRDDAIDERVRGLVFQRHDGLAVAAEGGDFLKIAVGLRQRHDRAVTENGVAAGGEVPASAFGVLLDLTGQPANRLRRFHYGETKQQG